MKTLLTLSLLGVVGCGAVESAFTKDVVNNVQVDSALTRAIEIYAQGGVVVTPDYPIGVVPSLPGNTIAVCVMGSDRYIAVSSDYVNCDPEWLALVMVHEIGHCTFGLGHTEIAVGQVMSPYSPYNVEDISSEAWSFFWTSVKASQGVNALNN